MLTLKLALRGLWRHRLRTAITVLAVASGHLFLLVFMSMHEGGHGEMIEMGIRQGYAGHVVIQAAGSREARSVELLVPTPERVQRVVAAVEPDARTTTRVFSGGLARSTHDSVGVMLLGVEPHKEREVSDLHEKITAGVYLGASAARVRATEEQPDQLWCARPARAGAITIDPVVIGQQLAKTLHVGLCDKIVVDAQGLGAQQAAQLRVVGIFKSGNVDLDGFMVQVPLATAQRLLDLGKSVHQVAVFLDSAKRSHPVAAALARTVGNGALGRQADLEVLPWDQALPELAEFVWLDASSGWVFMIIIFVIIGVGVLNTILMSVMERTRELGVMRALGMRPYQVGQLVLTEGFWLGVIGIVLGSLVAWPILHYLETTGIDLRQAGASMEVGGMSLDVMRGKSSWQQLLASAAAVFAMAFLSAFYPAIRAARLRVLKAVHHV